MTWKPFNFIYEAFKDETELLTFGVLLIAALAMSLTLRWTARRIRRRSDCRPPYVGEIAPLLVVPAVTKRWWLGIAALSLFGLGWVAFLLNTDFFLSQRAVLQSWTMQWAISAFLVAFCWLGMTLLISAGYRMLRGNDTARLQHDGRLPISIRVHSRPIYASCQDRWAGSELSWVLAQSKTMNIPFSKRWRTTAP